MGQENSERFWQEIRGYEERANELAHARGQGRADAENQSQAGAGAQARASQSDGHAPPVSGGRATKAQAHWTLQADHAARAAWRASPELQERFPTMDHYVAAVRENSATRPGTVSNPPSSAFTAGRAAKALSLYPDPAHFGGVTGEARELVAACRAAGLVRGPAETATRVTGARPALLPRETGTPAEIVYPCQQLGLVRSSSSAGPEGPPPPAA